MKESIKLVALMSVVGLAVLPGCGAPQLRPEAEIAAVGASFQKSAQDFTDARRLNVKNRQRTLNETEAHALQLREEVETALASWRIAGNKERLRIYEELLAASESALKRSEALATAREERASALAKADTKVSVDQQNLSKAFKLLASLGTELSPEETAKFLLDFAKQTREEVEKAAKEAQESAPQGAGNTTQP